MSETPRFTPAHRARLEVMLDENETTELPEQKAIRAALAEIDRLSDIEQKYQAVLREVETPLLPDETCEQCGGTRTICGKCGHEVEVR